MTEGSDERIVDELRLLGEEMRRLFQEERRAISSLDRGALDMLATMKQLVATRLGELAPIAPKSPELRALFQAVRVEAHATAVLAQAASRAVRALLGYEASTTYDKRARQTTGLPLRLLAAP